MIARGAGLACHQTGHAGSAVAQHPVARLDAGSSRSVARRPGLQRQEKFSEATSAACDRRKPDRARRVTRLEPHRPNGRVRVALQQTRRQSSISAIACVTKVTHRALCRTSGRYSVRRALPPADVVVRYNGALMDPCNRQFNCPISGFPRVGKIAIDSERARFTITVPENWLPPYIDRFCDCNDRTDLSNRCT